MRPDDIGSSRSLAGKAAFLWRAGLWLSLPMPISVSCHGEVFFSWFSKLCSCLPCVQITLFDAWWYVGRCGITSQCLLHPAASGFLCGICCGERALHKVTKQWQKQPNLNICTIAAGSARGMPVRRSWNGTKKSWYLLHILSALA